MSGEESVLTSLIPQDHDSSRKLAKENVKPTALSQTIIVADDLDPDDPNLTIPLPRYNAMLAVLRNTLYMYVPISVVTIVC